MAAGKLELPGNFQPGARYLVKGETLISWRKALMADRAIAGPGIRETGTPGGRFFEVSAEDTMPGFHPYGWEQTGETTWKCHLTPETVQEHSASAGFAPLGNHIPEIGTTPIFSDPPPELAMSPGQYAIMRIETEKSGSIIPPVTITAGTPPDGTFHIPEGTGPGGGDGQKGEWFIRLFQFQVVDGKPEILPHHLGPMDWLPWMWSAEVIGDGGGLIYKRYDPEKQAHIFRSLDSPNSGYGGHRQPETLDDEIQILGNNKWGNLRFLERVDGSPTLKAVLAVRDGLAGIYASDTGLPEFPEDVDPTNIDIVYSNCHSCGDGP